MKYLMTSVDTLGTFYFEVDEEGTALRQIIVQGKGSYIASNRKHEEYHFCLTDQEVEFNDPVYLHITKNEFEKAWSDYLQSLNDDWLQLKASLSVGAKVEGFIEVFYPHGVLVNLFHSNAIGLADYDECNENTPSEWLYPRYLVKSTVKGYDEDNLWVVLDKVEVLSKEYTE